MKRLIEMITDAGTGQLSHTKAWTHVAYCAATIAFLRLVFSENPPEWDIWVIYLGIVGGHNIASKIASMKLGNKGT